MQRDRSTSCRDNERPAIPSVPFKFVMFVKLESEKHLLESKSSVGSKFAVTNEVQTLDILSWLFL